MSGRITDEEILKAIVQESPRHNSPNEIVCAVLDYLVSEHRGPTKKLGEMNDMIVPDYDSPEVNALLKRITGLITR